MVVHINQSALSKVETEVLRRALLDHSVLVVSNQSNIDPTVLVQLAKIFDPALKDIHSGGEKQVTDPKNILSQKGSSRVSRAPQVSIIGQGVIEGHEGIPKIDLKHVDHTAFHESPLSGKEIEIGYTRPYRWHMDAPLYENLPGLVAVLHTIEVPDLSDQRVRLADDFELGIAALVIAAGATAFLSGARNFNLLSPAQQEFALNTTMHYVPRAYEWMKDCKASSDGLTIAKVGREKAEEELPPFSWDKVQLFPMVWKNSGNGRPHLQILGCCVRSLETRDPKTGETTVNNDLAEVRQICNEMQSRIYTAGNIYAHRWRKGDLVMFHNRGVLHSIMNQLSRYLNQKRLMWQCCMASGTVPKAYRSD